MSIERVSATLYRPSAKLVLGLVIALATLAVAGSRGMAATPGYDARTDVVQVTGGLIAATRDSGPQIRTFKAIPFAAPPVGDLRWRPPQPVVPWDGVRRSDNFSAACMQPPTDTRSIFYLSTEATSEDCLYLNVWTGAASNSERRPVMVFIYGGANVTGSGSQAPYSGAGLASKGAVVVTFNYRLGVFGFLAHPELTQESPDHASGNYGLLDQIAALQWVHSNIDAFGGDPADVTLYGVSAGAQDESVLLASPLARGLFARVIAESSSLLPAGAPNDTLADAERTGAALATSAGAASLAELRGVPAQTLLGSGRNWGPVVDGYVLPDQLDTLYASHQMADVPLLAGWNANEGTPFPPFATTADDFRLKAQQTYGDMAAQLLALYPVTTDEDAVQQSYAERRDAVNAWQIYTLARAHQAAGQSKTFLYYFAHVPPWYPDQHFIGQDPPSNFGAYHTVEQVYFYDTLSSIPRPYTDADRMLAAVSSSYLVNFATSGDPNEGPHAGLPTWPALVSGAEQVLLLDDSVVPGPVPGRTALAFFDAFYTKKLGRPLPV